MTHNGPYRYAGNIRPRSTRGKKGNEAAERSGVLVPNANVRFPQLFTGDGAIAPVEHFIFSRSDPLGITDEMPQAYKPQPSEEQVS
jgi:hypothetical protein